MGMKVIKIKRIVCFILAVFMMMGSVALLPCREVFADTAIEMTEVAQYALSWDGHTEIPYVYGGEGRNMDSLEEVSAAGAGLDCSGFVCLVYRHFNLDIPMQSTAILNAAVETFTDESQAVPGDVCWWEGHVAMYVGNGKIVHTNTPDPPDNYPHVSQISGDGANYRFPTKFLRMVEDVNDLRPISGTEAEETVEQVINTEPYGSIITESDLTGMVLEEFLLDEQKRLEMADRSMLTTAELANLEAIEAYFEQQDNVLMWYQVLQSFLGICCVFYGVLLIVAYLLDYSNVFFEFSLLAIITLGKLRVLDDKELAGINKNYYTGRDENRRVVYVTPRTLGIRVALLFALGAVLISGVIGDILVNTIFAAKDFLGFS